MIFPNICPDKNIKLKGQAILQIIPHLQTGGAERTTVDVARAIVAAGGRALVACEGGRMVQELEAAGGLWLPLPMGAKGPHQIMRNAAILKRLIQEHAIDLMHARSRAPAWAAWRACRKAGIPFVTTYHGIYRQTNWIKAFYNSVMARSDIVIANSQYTAELIHKRHPFAKDRIRVIYRGIDLDQFQPERISDARKQNLLLSWNIPQANEMRPLVLNVARLTPWKGQNVLINAIAHMRRNGHDVPMVILAGDAQGRTHFQDELKHMISHNNLDNDIFLVGHCADVPAALALANVCVVASTREEAFGRAAVESSIMGVPTIATHHGAASETVLAPPCVGEDMRTGWLIPPYDAQALADALVQVLNYPAAELQMISARARAHARDNFSCQTMCQKTLSVYSDLLNKKNLMND